MRDITYDELASSINSYGGLYRIVSFKNWSNNTANRVNLYETATVTAKTTLTIRKQPNINSASVGYLNSGAIVNVTHYPITDSSGYTWRLLLDGRGWVCWDYLKVTHGQSMISGNYRIQSANGKFLSYTDTPQNDVNIVMYEDLSGTELANNQIWEFTPLFYYNDSGAIAYRITPVLNSNYSLDCDPGNNELLHLWQNYDINAQYWMINTYIYSFLWTMLPETEKYIDSINSRFNTIELQIDVNTCKIYAETIYKPSERNICQVIDNFRQESVMARDLMRDFAFVSYEKNQIAKHRYSSEDIIEPCGEELQWCIDREGTLTISGKGAMFDYSVFNLAPWSKYSADIIKVVLDDRITTIGNYAFWGLNISNIFIPKSCNKIGVGAFRECKITNIDIPNNVEEICREAFIQCENLITIKFPSNISEIPPLCCSFCFLLKSVTIPESVSRIGEEAFSYCKSLTDINIPSGLESIGEKAFYLSGINNQNITN